MMLRQEMIVNWGVRVVLAAFLCVSMTSCGGSDGADAPGAPKAQTKPEETVGPISNEKAIEIARAEAKKKGFDETGFDVEARTESDGAYWVVVFKRIDPDFVGGGFEVTIDRETAKVEKAIFEQ